MIHAQIVSELIRALRGRRSQSQLSRRLGFSYNQVSRWESGERAIRWKDFVELCAACGQPLGKNVLLLGGEPARPADHSAIFTALFDTSDPAELSARAGVSRHVARLWLDPEKSVDLEDVLRVAEGRGRSPAVFLANFLPAEQTIPCLAEQMTRVRKAAHYCSRHPSLGVVSLFLSLKTYRDLPRHVPGFVAEHLGLTIDEEKFLLSLLVELDIIRYEADKWVHNSVGYLELCPRWPDVRKAMDHWSGIGMKKLHSYQDWPRHDRFRYLTVGVTEKTQGDIDRILQKAMLEIVELVGSGAEERQDDKVCVVLVQQFTLGQP